MRKYIVLFATLALVFVAGSAYAADADLDGMTDSWEITHFGTLEEGPQDDYDSDGWDNIAEFAAGTSPVNPLDSPGLDLGENVVGSVFDAILMGLIIIAVIVIVIIALVVWAVTRKKSQPPQQPQYPPGQYPPQGQHPGQYPPQGQQTPPGQQPPPSQPPPGQ
ncbi:MAG: hypothetical protein LN417_01070 [Candidatus Thermoplasmatota archaeon]|nr:hypothetical protein [Candidatus Thermoplasmatota archaeon]